MRRHLLMLALCACALSSPASGDAVLGAGPDDYTLAITGRCPGPITIYWWNATPDRRHAFLLAHEGGSAVIPYGPCAGTVLGLGERGLQFGMILPTGHGNGKIKAIMGNGACGYFVQLLEIPTCRTSNVARTP